MSSPEHGFVYVVRMEGSEYFKVGRSVDVPKRMSEFGLLLPFQYDLTFTHQVPHARHAEALLHNEFREKRLHGEWFLLGPHELERARAWLLLMQSRWLIERVVQTLYDMVFIQGDVGFPWLNRYCRILHRLEARDRRRLSYLGSLRRASALPQLESEAIS